MLSRRTPVACTIKTLQISNLQTSQYASVFVCPSQCVCPSQNTLAYNKTCHFCIVFQYRPHRQSDIQQRDTHQSDELLNQMPYYFRKAIQICTVNRPIQPRLYSRHSFKSFWPSRPTCCSCGKQACILGRRTSLTCDPTR